MLCLRLTTAQCTVVLSQTPIFEVRWKAFSKKKDNHDRGSCISQFKLVRNIILFLLYLAWDSHLQVHVCTHLSPPPAKNSIGWNSY